MKTYSFYGMQPDGKRTEAYLHELANPIVVTPLPPWPRFDHRAQVWRLLEELLAAPNHYPNESP